MKQIIILVALFGIAYFGYAYFSTQPEKKLAYVIPTTQKPYRIVYFQDITTSTRNYGIEIANSSLFRSFYGITDRNIELNYGVISRNSARKLITIHLAAAGFKKPIKPDFDDFTITDKAELSKEYKTALETYKHDSTYWHSNRAHEFDRFCKRVDSLSAALNIPKEAGGTDVRTAIDIADKAFNSPGEYENYLVLNSDGLDNHTGQSASLKNNATTILINAGRIQSTCIDKLLPKTFQSTEQAIEFILHRKTSEK